MSVRFTVIGSAGTHPSASRVCSSYLVRHEDTTLLLDMGSGSLHNLQKVIDLPDLDAVVISHLHPDHFVDLYALNYAMRFHPDSPGPIPVYGPAETHATVASMLPEESIERMAKLLHFTPAKAGQRLEVGALTIELFEMNHPTECIGSRITAGDTVISFTGDTAPTPQIEALGREADLLVIDATWLERQRPLPPDIHCTGLEAGIAATEAQAKRVMITHVSPYNDPAEVGAEAARAYDGEILLAVDLEEITL